MNKKIPMYKRVGAVFLCFALLCGVIVSTGAFPEPMTAKADTAANVESFEADFADLAALVGAEKWNATTNRYRPAETDTAIQNWINSRFGLYISREGSAYKPYSFLGQGSFSTGAEWKNSDDWSGEYWWEITKNGGLHSYCGNVGGQMLRKSQSLAIKYSDGTLAQLSNFEANVVFSKAGNTALGSVFLSFHQTDPGRMNTNTNTGVNTCNGTVAVVGNAFLTWVAGDPTKVVNATYGKYDKDGVTLGSLSGKDDRTMDEHFTANLDANADYNLYVKVVGTKMTTTISKVSDGSVVYTKEVDIPAGNGYLSVGSSNDDRVIKKIKVTELDAAGDPIDFGAALPFKWTTSGKTGYVNGKHTYNTESTSDDLDYFNFAESANNGKADKTSIINALNKNFDIYYNCESKYHQMQAGDKAAYDGQTADYGWFRGVYEDVWLQRPAGTLSTDGAGVSYSANMRLITSLVPKQSGKALTYKNFETTFKARLDNADASFVFGFRQATPGKFVDGSYNVNKKQALISITRTGIVVSGGENIYSGQTNDQPNTGDMYNTDATATFTTPITTGNAKNGIIVYVKAVGDQVTVKVTSGDNSVTHYIGTVTVPYTKPGYLAYGVANRGSDMGTIELTHLDEDGNAMPTNELTEAEEAFYAEPWTLSLTNVPGAEYKDGKYTATNNKWPQINQLPGTETIDFLNSKVDFYYNHEGSAYGEVLPYGNTGGYAASGNWALYSNTYIQRTSAYGSGERLRQINALVPKDTNGVQAQMKNLSASFKFRFENGDNGTGGPSTILFGFRQKNPAKFVNGHNAPNQEQVLVAITQKSIAVAGGTDITKERFYHYNQFADDDFGDVFSADLPQEVLVKIEAVGKNVTVKIYDLGGTSLKYGGTFTVNYTKEGYMAFGIAAASGNFGDLKLNRLDNNGNAIHFTDDTYMEPTWADGKTRFTANFAQLARQVDTFTDGKYVSTATDTDINNWLLSRFGMYGLRETGYYRELAYPGQSSSEWDDEPADRAAQWQIRESGDLFMKLNGDNAEMLRKTQSLAVKTSDGVLAKLKNFEAEVVFNKGGAHGFGAVYLSFRETQPGNFGCDWKGNMAGAVVDGVIIGNGDAEQYNKAAADGITAGNIKTNNNNGMRTKFSANLDNTADYKLYVKVVGTQLDWSITKVGEETAVASGIVTIADDAAGYLSVGARNRALKSITITELDKKGKVVDFGTTTKTVGEKFWFSVRDLIEYKDGKYTATKTNADGSVKVDESGNPVSGYNYYGFAGKYGDNYHPDASTAINYIDSKMALYYNCEAKYAQMEAGVVNAYQGQTTDTGRFGTLYANQWLQKNGSYGGSQLFRMVNSLVPRNSTTGEELQFENFETTFNVRFEGMMKNHLQVPDTEDVDNDGDTEELIPSYKVDIYDEDNDDDTTDLVPDYNVIRWKADTNDKDGDGDKEELIIPEYEQYLAPKLSSAILGFHQQTPGKFTDSYWKINKEQAFIMVSPCGITIAGGEDIVENMVKVEKTREDGSTYTSDQPGEGDMYNEVQTYSFNLDNPETAKIETISQDIKIHVKVVNNEVTLKVTNITGSVTYYDNSEAPITVKGPTVGYLAYGMGSQGGNIGDIELYRLNAEGERINVNGSDAPAPDCAWDTAVDRYSETMNATTDELEALYDFYYSFMDGDVPTTVKEPMSAHWALNESGILMRQNDLSDNATENVAMIRLNENEEDTKFSDFDAVFKLTLDEKQQGTFWVTGRQQNGALVGKVVSTPGDTDYVAGQVTVGFSVGGAITISDGTANPIVIAGPTAGTPTGTYILRVRLYGNMLEVYVNGKQRVARSLANTASADGYLTFGYSGAELGIGSVDVTRLNEQGVPVSYEPKCVSVSSNTVDPIIVSKGESEAAVRAQLDTTLTVTDADSNTIPSEVYWDFSTVDFSMNGDYKLIGYLKETNDVRAVVNVYVGAYDRSITTQYDFADGSQLDDFTSWFMPTTNEKDQPALYTEGTENDGWYINNGRLTQKNTGIRLTDDELVGGKTINEVTYQDNRNWRGYASNFSVAVLNTKKFENFVLEVDVVSSYRWTLVGFGAQDPADALSVFPTHTKGGYSFHIEHNSGYNTGTAKFWGYDPDTGKADTIVTKSMDPYDLSTATQHVKIIVSDGHVWYYLNDIEAAFEAELPATYEGGYIFLASNENGGGFDNLRITDLDAKTINITEILTPEPEESEIDRAAGESLSVAANGMLKVADESGYEYELPYNLISDTYRSNLEGKHEFEAVFSPLHNMTVASDLEYKVTVDNKINGDYNTETTVKYYFDHPNDFLDFYSQYSEPRTVTTAKYGEQTYYSGYDGNLVTVDADKRWTVKNGRATTSYSANPGNWGGMGKAIGTSTLILKDLNLINFRVEMDFTQGSNFWYSYMIFGVQNPNKMFGTTYWGDNNMTWEKWLDSDSTYTSTAYDHSLGGGIWCHLEQQGYFNMQGALDGSTDYRFTEDVTTGFIKTYNKKIQHHMVIEVVDGLLSMKVDDSDTYYLQILDDAIGGLVGFGACGNGSTYDNFQITALDDSGQPIALADAEKGWKPEPIPDNYEGWQPVKDEWFFTWGEEYEKEIKDNTK